MNKKKTMKEMKKAIRKGLYLAYGCTDIEKTVVHLSRPHSDGTSRFYAIAPVKMEGYSSDMVVTHYGVTSPEAVRKMDEGYLPWYSRRGEL